ncbi:MAG: AbrB/MazE/SpoVT family DNA-binding domain-containing protein [Chloroflexi bacterium]|nr:AbrB/MazE/SpoVT family DNA-binding domain-containing protein [Chloroflexota bacterium]
MARPVSHRMIIRPRRQVTLPAEVCDSLGLAIGDQLEVEVKGGAIVATPRKSEASEALTDIRRIFEAHGPPLEEIQKEGRQVRRDIYRERYGKKQ